MESKYTNIEFFSKGYLNQNFGEQNANINLESY